MCKFQDLTGMKFGRWTVIERAPNSGKHTVWFCECECGTKGKVTADSLKCGDSKSCGCYHSEVMKEFLTGHLFRLSHGYSRHPAFKSWYSMVYRCMTNKHVQSKDYKDRNIKVCDEWKDSPEKFIEWAMVNGWEKGMTIDRIDNDGDYCPENCQWLTRSENSKKRWKQGKWKRTKE